MSIKSCGYAYSVAPRPVASRSGPALLKQQWSDERCEIRVDVLDSDFGKDRGQPRMPQKRAPRTARTTKRGDSFARAHIARRSASQKVLARRRKHVDDFGV